MRRALTTFVAIFALLGAAAASAGAANLSASKARARAQGAAAARAHSRHDIVAWEISRGFRFTSTKWVFVWFGQLSNGQGCGAQLVVRLASSHSSKAVTYFRNQTCS